MNYFYRLSIFLLLFLNLSKGHSSDLANLCLKTAYQHLIQTRDDYFVSIESDFLKNYLKDSIYENVNAKIPKIKINPEETFLYPESKLSWYITNYTGSGFKTYNQQFSNAVKFKPITYLKKQNQLAKALDAYPLSKKQVYSGAAFSEADFLKNDFHVGKTFSFDYFLSTSSDFRVAADFAIAEKKTTDVKRVLFSFKSKSGRNISSYSRVSYEKEVLFKPGTQFKVLAMEPITIKDSTYTVMKIELEELGSVPEKLLPPSSKIKKIEYDPIIDDQRFVNETDFKHGTDIFPNNPAQIYGIKSAQNWKNGLQFIEDNYKTRGLSLELLQDIHKITMYDQYYFGFERRRIKQAFLNKEIDLKRAIKALRDNNSQKAFTKTDHTELAGKIRNSPIDHFITTGEHINEKKIRYFSQDELENLAKNPFFTIEESSIQAIGENQFKAIVHYPPPSILKNEIENAIASFNELTIGKKISDRDYIKNVVKLESTLMSLHPFLDGNGRTIRLLSDFLYRKRGLPPPIKPRKNDYAADINQATDETIENMLEYLKLKKPSLLTRLGIL